MIKIGDIIYRLMKYPLALEIREVIGIQYLKSDRWPNRYIIETIPIVAANDFWQSISRVPVYDDVDNLHTVLHEAATWFVSCNEELIIKKYEELLRNA